MYHVSLSQRSLPAVSSSQVAAVEKQMRHGKLAVKHPDRGFCVNAAMNLTGQQAEQ